MKKLLLVIAAVAMLLSSCKKINEALDSLDGRLDKLEQETIPSIDEQISAINTTLGNLDAMDKELKGYIDNLTTTASSLQEQINATNTKIDEVTKALQKEIEDSNAENLAQLQTAKSEVLAQLATAKTELENELAQINATIETLKEKDKELDEKIKDLNDYVNNELTKTTTWVEATFATLEQYNALVSEVATIKEQIKAINQSIIDLESRLTTKINEDIATAVSTLNADIQQKVKDITDAYTSAIKGAKEEITAAYTSAIQTAITTLDNSLKTWVGEQLSNYYTIAQIDALLAAMEQEMNGKLEAQKAYLEGLINELSAALTKSIADNKVLIDGLRSDVTTLQGELAEHATKITENATAISANAQSIIDNATAIANNGTDISANEKAIADNKALNEANAKLIADNKSAIETLKNSTATAIAKNATDITQNASAIAKNATLISQNATAINNNITAVAKNSTDILQLQLDLTETKNEITEAYQKAINDAISTNNGVINNKITNEVTSINSRIDSEVATINNALDALAARVATLEREVNAIKQQIADILEDISNMKDDIANLLSRIQSISYIPQYDDGKATVVSNGTTSQVTLDFEVSPKDAVVELAKVWQSAVSVKAIYTQTRAVSFIDMPIISFKADVANGAISVTASGENLSAEFFNGTQSASARLSISDGNNSVVSDYVSMVAIEELIPDNQIWYTSTDGKIVTPYATYATDAFNANIVSNTYENGKGVIKFDGDITSIGDWAFNLSTSLTSVTIPDSVTSIGMQAFYNCTSLTSVSIPDSVTTIGYDAFSDCTSLTSVPIPDSVTTIGGYAFADCTSLTSVTIPNSVTEIGKSAFKGCSSLTSVTIPDSVTSIGRSVFFRCSSLKAFYGKFASADNRCLVIDGVLNSFAPAGLTEYTIHDSVTSIGDWAFRGCTSLTSVTIPNSVTSIGERAFFDCTSLTSVTIGNGVTTIGSYAFGDCTSLTSVYCRPTTPPAVYYSYENSSLSHCFPTNSGLIIYVPRESYYLYTKYTSYANGAYQTNWSQYKSYVQPYDFE